MGKAMNDLVKYRMDCSRGALEEAKIMFNAEHYKNAVNRSYYFIFYAIRSVNALDEFDSKKHSGVISYFIKMYVKTGIFPVEASKLIQGAYKIREKADYEDFFIVSRDDAEKQINDAEAFLRWTEKYFEELLHVVDNDNS